MKSCSSDKLLGHRWFFGESWASDLLKDCKNVTKLIGYVSQHYFKFGDTLYEKPNIYELDLHDDPKRNSRGTLLHFENAGPSFVTEARKKFPFFKLQRTSPPQ